VRGSVESSVLATGMLGGFIASDFGETSGDESMFLEEWRRKGINLESRLEEEVFVTGGGEGEVSGDAELPSSVSMISWSEPLVSEAAVDGIAGACNAELS
jgi:hypothetical protein